MKSGEEEADMPLYWLADEPLLLLPLLLHVAVG